MAKAASTTTPVLPLFLMGAFCLPQAEKVEGFTAHLAENKLKKTNHKNTSHNFFWLQFIRQELQTKDSPPLHYRCWHKESTPPTGWLAQRWECWAHPSPTHSQCHSPPWNQLWFDALHRRALSAWRCPQAKECSGSLKYCCLVWVSVSPVNNAIYITLGHMQDAFTQSDLVY